MGFPHNVYFRIFWSKNTISCGGFFLLTKHIVSGKNGGVFTFNAGIGNSPIRA